MSRSSSFYILQTEENLTFLKWIRSKVKLGNSLRKLWSCWLWNCHTLIWIHFCISAKISKTSGAQRHLSSLHGVDRIFQLFQNHRMAQYTLQHGPNSYRTAQQSIISFLQYICGLVPTMYLPGIRMMCELEYMLSRIDAWNSTIQSRICKHFKEPGNRFPALRAGTITLFVVRPARLHRLAESIPRNRFLSSINVYKYGLCRVCPKTFVWAAEFVHKRTHLKNNTG